MAQRRRGMKARPARMDRDLRPALWLARYVVGLAGAASTARWIGVTEAMAGGVLAVACAAVFGAVVAVRLRSAGTRSTRVLAWTIALVVAAAAPVLVAVFPGRLVAEGTLSRAAMPSIWVRGSTERFASWCPVPCPRPPARILAPVGPWDSGGHPSPRSDLVACRRGAAPLPRGPEVGALGRRHSVWRGRGRPGTPRRQRCATDGPCLCPRTSTLARDHLPIGTGLSFLFLHGRVRRTRFPAAVAAVAVSSGVLGSMIARPDFAVGPVLAGVVAGTLVGVPVARVVSDAARALEASQLWKRLARGRGS